MTRTNKHFIVFCGEMGSGKDYSARTFLHYYENILKSAFGLTIAKLAFADVLRMELYNILEGVLDAREISLVYNVTEDEAQKLLDFGLNAEDFLLEEKPEGVREALIFWGTEVRRKQDKNYWTDKWVEMLENIQADIIMVTDARFENELDLLLGEKSFMYYMNTPFETRLQRLIQRDGDGLNYKAMSHSSETTLEKWVDAHRKDIYIGSGYGEIAAAQAFNWLVEDTDLLKVGTNNAS